MKTFLGLPIYETGVTSLTLVRHVASTVLFSGLGYFILSMISGLVLGKVWKFIQAVETQYVAQAFLLTGGIILGVVLQSQLNRLDDKVNKFFFHYPKIDKYLYPFGALLTYLILNQIFGL